MKRYRLNIKIREKFSNGITKVFPDIDGKNVKNKESFFETDLHWDKFYNPEPTFDFLQVRCHGEDPIQPWILADVHGWIGNRPMGLHAYPISPKFKSLLESYYLSPSRFYPGKVLFEGKFHEYYVWHILRSPYLDFIDFPNSTFTEWKKFDFEKVGLNTYTLNTPEEYFEMERKIRRERTYHLSFDKIAVHHSFKNNDCCWFPKLGYVISERLKNAIEDTGITGVQIEELTEVQFEYA